MRTKLTLTLIFLLVILTSHSHLAAGGIPPGTIDVSILYRERIMVPPGSTVRVTLSDVSKMDVPATEISSVSQEISTGSYTHQNDSLEFSQVAATMKMCTDDMDQEKLFFSLLEATAAYELSGDELHLYDDEKELIGSFKAIYFK